MVRLSRLPSALASGFVSAAFAAGLAATSALDIGAPGFFLAAAIACTADICLVCYGDCVLAVKTPAWVRTDHAAGQYRPARHLRRADIGCIASGLVSERTFSQGVTASSTRARFWSNGVVGFYRRDRELCHYGNRRDLDANSLVLGSDRRGRRDLACAAGAAGFSRPYR